MVATAQSRKSYLLSFNPVISDQYERTMAPTIAQVLCSTSLSIKLLALALSAEQITWPQTIKQHLVFEPFLLLDFIIFRVWFN